VRGTTSSAWRTAPLRPRGIQESRVGAESSAWASPLSCNSLSLVLQVHVPWRKWPSLNRGVHRSRDGRCHSVTLVLRVVGAGLPRTGTHSLKLALGSLLGGDCFHMTSIPGHPFDLGPVWRAALAHGELDSSVLDGYVACADWPASMFWRQLSGRSPGAFVLLSRRDSADAWWESMEATILPYARMSRSDTWTQGRDLVTLFERFAGTPDWDDYAVLTEAYERHLAAVRDGCEPARLIEWMPTDGWPPICRALGLPEPDHPFPSTNRREEWQ
jgi:hypothetical protein